MSATTVGEEGSEQGRVETEPVAAQPADGAKQEGTPPDDGGTSPRFGGGVEVADPAGTGSAGTGNPDGVVGCSTSVPSSPPSLSEWLNEVRANRVWPDGGRCWKVEAIGTQPGQIGPV